MIPLSLVTGFLGSGKTTLLRRFAAASGGRRLVFVVNEFAPLDVDGQLLGDGADLVSIAGGSIFCRCKTTAFVERLAALAARHRAEALDGVVVEASGIADPRVVRKMLAETGLDRDYALARVIAVADPLSLPKLLHTLPNIRHQLEAADVVLLNKTDLAAVAAVEAAEAAVRAIHPGVELRRVVRCETDVDPIGPRSACAAAGGYAACVDPRYSPLLARIDGAPSRAELAARLDALADDLYRAKGWAACAEGPSFVEFASGRASVEPAAALGPAGSAVAVIGRGGSADRIAAALAPAANAPA